MQKVLYLAYEPQFNAYVISDQEVSRVIANGEVPKIVLPTVEAEKLGLDISSDYPTIGFLLG